MTALLIIYAIVIAVLSGFCYFYKNEIDELKLDNDILKRRNDTLEEKFETMDVLPVNQAINAQDFLLEMGRKHQFEVEELERTDVWITNTFVYQGGQFVCYTGADGDELVLCFRGIASRPYTPENYEKVRNACHYMTKEYRYAKVFYRYDNEENQLDIDIRMEAIHPTEDAFMYYLKLCFEIRDEVVNGLYSTVQTTEEDHLDHNREEWMLIKSEQAHETTVIKERKPHTTEPNHGTLGEYLSYLFNGEKTEDLLSLRIQTAQGITQICQRDRIAKFDVLGSVLTGEGEKAQFASDEPIVLTVDAVTNNYIFTLHPIKACKEFLTVRMTAVCTPHEFLQDYVPDATYEPQAVSLLLCYVKTELPEVKDEDALEQPTTNISKQVRHGRKLMQQNCYLQAIAVLTPVNKQLKSRFFNLNAKDKDLYFSTCYDLGFCYTDLRLYEKAFYYLHIANGCNLIDYSQEYINCLAECRDIRVFNVIDKELESINKMIDEIDQDENRGTEKLVEHREQLVNYYAFLQRRRGYSQINFGYLDDAEQTFKHLLDHEGSRKYAERELQYIETLKNNKS